jgi:ferrous iron transport protein A
MTLAEAPEGQKVRVVAILEDQPITRRLREMGLVVGEVVCITRIAPLGDPLQISIKKYTLALRRKEAACFEVEACQ